jgi:hypothetical protein
MEFVSFPSYPVAFTEWPRSKFLSNMAEIYLPGFVQQARKNAADWFKVLGIMPEFGWWWNFCPNFPDFVYTINDDVLEQPSFDLPPKKAKKEWLRYHRKLFTCKHIDPLDKFVKCSCHVDLLNPAGAFCVLFIGGKSLCVVLILMIHSNLEPRCL